jgi:hypothetical protein
LSTIPPLAFVAKDAEPRLVLSAAKDDPSANTHVLNEVKDQRRANPHRDSLEFKIVSITSVQSPIFSIETIPSTKTSRQTKSDQ